MPGPRNLPQRSSQRRTASSQQDEEPSRTRSGRGPKSAAKDKPDTVSPKATSHSVNMTPATRKTSRTTSNITNYANLEAGSVVYATYEAPIFQVYGLSQEFFDRLAERKPLTKQNPSDESELPALNTFFDEPDSMSEDSSDEPPSPQPTTTRGRGRGGRGTRGGRGRGGRGRGSRGGRGAKASVPASRTESPLRTRPSRNAAPAFPLAEEDDDEPSNQESAEDAKSSPDPEEEFSSTDEDAHRKEEEKHDVDAMEDVQQDSFVRSKTPPGSPPAALLQAYEDPDLEIPVPVAVPKISLPEKSQSRTRLQTSRGGTSTPVVVEAPKPLAPEDDALSESDLPAPWLEDAPSPIEAECDDRADYLLQTRFKPMVDAQDVITALTKFPLAQRSTASLYMMAQNTAKILKAWQDEFLLLDARTAPHAHPPKKPANGGRIPINPAVYEDMKEADIYGYIYDPKKPQPGLQDPFTQRPGHEKSGGRELRQRRTRDMLDSAAPSEDDEDEEEGRPAKRQRRATRRFEGSDAGTATGTNTPKKNNGWGGARKKGVSKYSQPTLPPSATTPEPDGRGKRGKGLLHHRIQEMREESAVASSGDEGSSNANSMDDDERLDSALTKRGGRGGGRGGRGRGGYGQKGPKKRTFEEDTAVPFTHAPNGPPPALHSISEGQNQFTLNSPVGTAAPAPVVGSHSTETVFQATPQPPAIQEMSAGPLSATHSPDAYMNTTPLSQYSIPYDDSANNSASGSRKKPRVKSEKRSQSMTIWWAERKARQKEADEKSGTPPKPATSRTNSGTGRRGGRTSAAGSPGLKALPEPLHRQVPFYADSQPPPLAPQETQPFHSHPHQPLSALSAPSPSAAYASASYPPPPSLVMQPSPLAALPTSIPPSPSTGMPPGPGRTLAPAPLPPQVPMAAYPSPFGPRTAPRPPKSNGPLPLAPAPLAPNHVSPYPPLSITNMSIGAPAPTRDMPFKVLVPGHPPDARRGSR